MPETPLFRWPRNREQVPQDERTRRFVDEKRASKRI